MATSGLGAGVCRGCRSAAVLQSQGWVGELVTVWPRPDGETGRRSLMGRACPVWAAQEIERDVHQRG